MSGRRERLRSVELVRARRANIGATAVTSFVGGLCEAAFLVLIMRCALAVANGINLVQLVGPSSVDLNAALLIAAAILAIRVALALIAGLLTATAAIGVGTELRRELVDSYLRSPWATQNAARSGHLQELVITDAGAASGYVSAFSTALGAALNLAAMLAVCFVLDTLASVATIATLIAVALVIGPLRRQIKHHATDAVRRSQTLATSITELSSLNAEIHTFGVQRPVSDQLRRSIDEESATRHRIALLQHSIGPTYAALAYAALLLALAMAARSGPSHLSNVGAVMLVLLRSLAYGQSLQNSVATMLSAAPHMGAIDEAIAEFDQKSPRSTDDKTDCVGDLIASRVAFAYNDAAPVFSDLTFSLPANSMTGVIGPSGSGKSTLMYLLLGLHEPSRGAITVAGVDLRSINPSVWSQHVGYVPQNPHLFAGTIAENIAFFREDIERCEIERVTLQANLHQEVLAMPQGYDTPVGERGERLSGGQRQRLAIARALLQQPALLVLDEPTSALDAVSEAAIHDAIADLRGTTTIVIIAHRLSTLELCQQLIVLHTDDTFAYGTHAQLRVSDAFYRETAKHFGLALPA